MLVEKNIVVYSTCEHHLMPIIGRAHIAYLSKDRVIGLSKMNRIVDYYAKRPQVQERLTRQITNAMQEALGTLDVAVLIDAKHLCVNARGIRDIDSSTVTAEYGGKFQNDEGLKVGAFIAPSLEAAFKQDLRPVIKGGFTKKIELPKVRTITQSEIDAHNSGERPLGELEEEPKQTVFSPASPTINGSLRESSYGKKNKK